MTTMWNSEHRSDRYSPSSLVSDWSEGHNYYNHSHIRESPETDKTDNEDQHSLVGCGSDSFGPKQFYEDGHLYKRFSYDRGSNSPGPEVRSPGFSVAQASSQAFKCRQLPCRTFVSTGSCPYGDRCVFLHDPAIVSKPVYIKTKVF
jgi:hypothetical protein